MLQEYAIRPKDITNDWRTFNFLKDKFGIQLGRVISDFPQEKWIRRALESSKIYGTERHQVVEWFKKIDGPEPQDNTKHVVLVDRGRRYHESHTWIENAKREHLTHPFHAVISNQQTGEIRTHDADEIWGSAIWEVDTGNVIEREAGQIAEVARPLLRFSTEILLVDPYFRAYEDRFRASFKSLVEIIDDECVDLNRFEIHLGVASKPVDRDPVGEFLRYNEQKLSPLLSDGMQVLLYRWENIPQSDRMHPRYILTDLGGIRYDFGLDAPNEEGQTTDVQLLTPKIYERRWADYQIGTSPFKLHDGNPIPVDS